MNIPTATSPAFVAKVAALIETLRATEQQLDELTSGEVDTVADASGRTFLLQRAQEQLRHHEAAKQAAILDALPAHIALVDREGFIITVNERWRRFAASQGFLAPRHGVGSNYLLVCDTAAGRNAEEARATALGLRAVLSGERDRFSIEYPCHAADAQRWFQLTITPLVDGQAGGAIVMHSDVTDRALAQRSKRGATELMQAVVDGTPELICIKDLQRRYLLCNAAFARFVGRSAKDILGTRVDDQFGEDEARRLIASDQAVITSGRASSSELALTGASGIRTYHALKTPFLNDRGEVIGVIGIYRDVTEQRALIDELKVERARLLAVQDVAKIGSWTLDIGSGTYQWSDEMYRIFATDRTSFEPTIENAYAYIHPEDLTAVLLAGKSPLGPDTNTRSVEHRVILPGGNERIVEQRWQILDGTDGGARRVLGTCQDITERMNAEQALRESRSLLAMSSRLTHVGAWSVDLPASKVIWSDAVATIHDEPPGFHPPVAEAFRYYVHEHHGAIKAAFDRCVTDGSPFDVELEIVTAKHRRIWVRTIGEAVLDANGVVRRVQGALQDLSERKGAEEEVRRMALRLTNALESISDGFLTIDREWRFTYVSGQAEGLLCMTGEQLLGNVMWDVLPQMLGTGAEKHCRDAMSGGNAIAFETFYDRSAAWFSVNCFPTEEGISIYFRDDTVKREERQRLELLEASVARLNDIVMITDAGTGSAQRKIVFVNDAFIRLTGHSREEVIGKSTDILHGPLTDRTVLARMRAGTQRFEPTHGEIINYRKNGEWYWIEFDTVPVNVAGGSQSHFVIIQRDITERKRDQEALVDLNAQLEARVELRTAELKSAREQADLANQAKSSFLAMMSHEIRTPMNGVIGMIDVLEQTSLRTSQVEIVKTVRESAYALLGIVDDVLDFSKIEAGQFQIDSEPMDISAVVESACDTLGPLADQKGVTLLLFTEPDLPPSVLGDGARLRQVLLNLIGNAIKFSSTTERKGRVSVRALLAACDARTAHLEIVVEDNGIGMDAHARSLLFAPFTQADASTTRRFGGTGLGLSISCGLIHMMDGRILVQSEPGVGSKFTVEIALPIIAKNVPAIPPDGIAGLRCLVLGEAESQADDLVVYLRGAGALAHRAENAAGAAQWLAGCPREGSIVVVAHMDSIDATYAECKRACQADSLVQMRFVVIERGRRRKPRMRSSDVISLDGEVMHRAVFLKAVALAAGKGVVDSGADASVDASQMDSLYGPRQGVILIAEDNEINQRVLQKQLALLGFESEVAANGQEALERTQKGAYALLLTDLHMPVMDGYALTQAVRAAEAEADDARRMPVVALTANAVKGEAKRCRDLGMDDYMTKPVQLSALRTMLDKWMPNVHQQGSNDSDLTSSIDGAFARIDDAATAPPVDLNVLAALVGSDPVVLDEMLDAFSRSAVRSSAEIRRLLSDGASGAAADAAHMLKSSARSIGARRLADVCTDIESSSVGSGPDALRVLSERFQIEMLAVMRFLEEPSGVSR